MRIIAGQFRSRPIVAPIGQETRPTADRTRQALFDVISHAAWAPDLAGARVVDLFAGSGALGFEALSRGAGFCLFVETDEQARGAIRQNIEALALFGQTRVHRRDACDLGLRPASAGGPFSLALLDPPYKKGLGEKAAAELLQGGWLAAGAVVAFERSAQEPLYDLKGFTCLDDRRWGAACVGFYTPKD